MARSRVELQALLEQTLGSRNVYFQPPESIKMSYPCIIYDLSRNNNRHANNKTYIRWKEYKVMLITKDPDSPLVDKLDDLEYFRFDRVFTADNLYHYVYNVNF